MTRITIDDDTRAKLHNLQGYIELCDEAGKTLGYFFPPGTLKSLSPVSDAEIEELRKQRSGRSLAEILRDLEART